MVLFTAHLLHHSWLGMLYIFPVRPSFTASSWSAQTPGAESKEVVPHGMVVRLDTCVKNDSQLLPALLS